LVAVLLQDGGPGDGVLGQAEAGVGLVRGDPVGDAEPRAVAAGQERRPARRADRRRYEGVEEVGALPGEAVHVGRLHLAVAVGADAPAGLVVGDDGDEIVPLRLGGGRGPGAGAGAGHGGGRGGGGRRGTGGGGRGGVSGQRARRVRGELRWIIAAGGGSCLPKKLFFCLSERTIPGAGAS